MTILIHVDSPAARTVVHCRSGPGSDAACAPKAAPRGRPSRPPSHAPGAAPSKRSDASRGRFIDTPALSSSEPVRLGGSSVIASNEAATAAMSIAGRPLTVRGHGGGMLVLRIALQGGTATDLARDLASVDGVRVARGPGSIGRGTCFLAHCHGFKIVFSADEVEGSLSALVSRVPIDVDSGATSDLSALLTLLMRQQPPAAGGGPRPRVEATSVQPRTSLLRAAAAPALRRTALRPGKPLSRTTPLLRKKPLGRGKSGRSNPPSR